MYIALICIFLLCIIAFVCWANKIYKPTQQAKNDMLSDNKVTVITKKKFIIFKPTNITPSEGLIFYPGAKVEPIAYSSLCRKIAEKGFLVVIAPMTLNLAVFSPNKAKYIINEFKHINTWTMSGHSLGGVMASNYALKDSKVNGVIFYASYPQNEKLKNSNMEVLSIYGDLDGVAKLKNINYDTLPKNSKIIEIKGGNHAQFGSYGIQSGDNNATISNTEQINLSAKYTLEFLNRINKKNILSA